MSLACWKLKGPMSLKAIGRDQKQLQRNSQKMDGKGDKDVYLHKHLINS